MNALHFHWQNLNEDRDGRVKGWPYHGRCWLYVGRVTFRFSWNLWARFCGVSLGHDREDGLALMLALPPISLWFGMEAPWIRGREREVSLMVHDAAVWWRLWTNPNSWSSRTPRWREGCWHVLDTLLGKARYSKRTLSQHRVAIPMPEGSYPATVELDESTWERPRWFAKRERFATVALEVGIPHEGKGENSWDCGTDCLTGLSCKASTVEEAIAATVRSALRSRRRYDGNVMAEYPAPSAGGAR